MTSSELFRSVGFVDRYYVQMSDFYRDSFSTEDEMIEFFVKVFRNDTTDKTPRQMMNQIQQLVSIANDIDRIRPARDPLRMFFIKTCMEALCSLSKNKKENFYKEFPTFMSTEGKDYILSHFSLSHFDEIYMGHPFQASHELTIDDFFSIIKVVRDIVAHEGNYWEMQFFTHSTDDATWLSSLETDKKILKSYKYLCERKLRRTYHFETTMQYERFRHYFLEACIGFLLAYISEKESKKEAHSIQ